MIRVGADTISIKRVKEAITRTPQFAHRLYSPEELAYCQSKVNPYPSLAARFAAREALRKLHPLFMKTEYRDIAVEIDAAGRPRFWFSPELYQKAKAAGLLSLDLSLSHDEDQAFAVTVAEWKEDLD